MIERQPAGSLDIACERFRGALPTLVEEVVLPRVGRAAEEADEDKEGGEPSKPVSLLLARDRREGGRHIHHAEARRVGWRRVAGGVEVVLAQRRQRSFHSRFGIGNRRNSDRPMVLFLVGQERKSVELGLDRGSRWRHCSDGRGHSSDGRNRFDGGFHRSRLVLGLRDSATDDHFVSRLGDLLIDFFDDRVQFLEGGEQRLDTGLGSRQHRQQFHLVVDRVQSCNPGGDNRFDNQGELDNWPFDDWLFKDWVLKDWVLNDWHFTRERLERLERFDRLQQLSKAWWLLHIARVLQQRFNGGTRRQSDGVVRDDRRRLRRVHDMLPGQFPQARSVRRRHTRVAMEKRGIEAQSKVVGSETR